MTAERPWKQPAGGQPPPQDYRETVEFLEQLRPGGPWTLTAIVPDGPTETITTDDPEQVVKFVRFRDKHKNLYFSVNPTRSNLIKKASKFDIAAIEYIPADLDPKHDETPEQAKARYLTALTSYHPPSTVIIDSGNGIQALWKLAEPITLGEPIAGAEGKKSYAAQDAKIIEDVEQRAAALMLKLGSVAGTQNIDRILRLPGTTNIPNKKKLEAGRTPCPTKLIRFNNSIHMLEAFPAPEQPIPTEQPQAPKSATALGDLFAKLPAALKKAIAAPPYEGEDTSSTAASVIEQLQTRGVSDPDIIALFNTHPRGIGKRYVEGKDLSADVLRIRRKFQPQATSKKTSLVLCAADIRSRAKDWVWPGHLLRGAQELLTGIPGLGKSQVQIHFIACATAGLPWPDGAPAVEPMNVIMLTAEDTLEQEVKPRLLAAGADCRRVFILNRIRSEGKDRQFLLAEDLDQLERIVLDIGNVGLITLDPITAYMGGKMDSHKATEVRSQLGPLKDFAERTNIALSTITHPPKSAGTRAIDHFIGSQAFIAAGRIGHICTDEMEKDEEGARVPTGRKLFSNAKTNVHKMMPSLAYKQEVKFVEKDHVTGVDVDAPFVVWEGEVEGVTADDAVAASNGSFERKEKAKEHNKVQNWLCDMLREGPVAAPDIEAAAFKEGFTGHQLRYAKDKLGVVSEKTRGEVGPWMWRLLL